MSSYEVEKAYLKTLDKNKKLSIKEKFKLLFDDFLFIAPFEFNKYYDEEDKTEFLDKLRIMVELFYNIKATESLSISFAELSSAAQYSNKNIIINQNQFSSKMDGGDLFEFLDSFAHEMCHYASDVQNNYDRKQIGKPLNGQFVTTLGVQQFLAELVGDDCVYGYYYCDPEEMLVRHDALTFVSFFIQGMQQAIKRLAKKDAKFASSKTYSLAKQYFEAMTEGYNYKVKSETELSKTATSKRKLYTAEVNEKVEKFQETFLKKYSKLPPFRAFEDCAELDTITQTAEDKDFYNFIRSSNIIYKQENVDKFKEILNQYLDEHEIDVYAYVGYLLSLCNLKNYVISQEEIEFLLKRALYENSNFRFYDLWDHFNFIERQDFVKSLIKVAGFEKAYSLFAYDSEVNMSPEELYHFTALFEHFGKLPKACKRHTSSSQLLKKAKKCLSDEEEVVAEQFDSEFDKIVVDPDIDANQI